MSESLKGDVTKRSVEHQASETALATAFMRALAARDDRKEIRGTDYLAEIFLPGERKAPLNDLKVRQWVMKNKVAPGAYEFMVARTAFFDHVVRDELLRNIPQIVLLGAGYDSRPYRFKELLKQTRIFELDAQPTQLRKQELLGQAGIPVPEHVTFVPVDFNRENLKEVLLEAGFSGDERALFVWEGVTYYLSAEVVDNTLGVIRTISPAGSSVCFDFASLSTEALGEEGAKKLREHMKSKHPAEPTKFGIPQGKLGAFLTERGYVVIEHLSSSEMEARYLTLQDGSTAGKVPALFSLVHAVLAGSHNGRPTS
jgi:methyltransferase (TIGR00027 family)